MNEFCDFYQAISGNRVQGVKRLLKEGECPDSEAVVCAIQHNAHDVLRLLIRARADVDRPEAYWGYTPLIRAMHDGNETAFRMLLRAGADINKRGRIWAPLHWAAKEGSPRLQNSVSLPEPKSGCTRGGFRLHHHRAASMGHLEVVKLLLKAGANLYENAEGDSLMANSIVNLDTKWFENESLSENFLL